MIPAVDTESGPDCASAEAADHSPAKAANLSATALKRRRQRSGLGSRLFLVLLAFMLAFAAFGLSGKAITLPVWAVAELEQRINRSLPGTAVSLGGVDIQVDADWVPLIRLDDLRMLKSGGGALLTLPDLRVTLDPKALLRGHIRPSSLRIIGAQLKAVRDTEENLISRLAMEPWPPRSTALPSCSTPPTPPFHFRSLPASAVSRPRPYSDVLSTHWPGVGNGGWSAAA